jgi:asparagine N-glycosylation enzyme membrane subunit Stt3
VDKKRIAKYFVMLMILQTVVLFVELLLIGHSEGWQQMIPLVALVVLFIIFLLSYLGNLRSANSWVYGFLLVNTVVGLLGLFFHMKGNIEFEKELYPGLSGIKLLTEAATGATPILAPLSMTGLGLLGLLYFKLKESFNYNTK